MMFLEKAKETLAKHEVYEWREMEELKREGEKLNET